jgi:hypothetical protein
LPAAGAAAGSARAGCRPAARHHARRAGAPWVVSLLLHVVAILSMALIVTAPPRKDASVAIVSSVVEEDADVETFWDNLPEPPVVETTDPLADGPLAEGCELWRRHPADRVHYRPRAHPCDGRRQDPAPFEPEVRKRAMATMALPA